MVIANPDIERYILSLDMEEDEVLRDMERLALMRHFPIVGPLVGRLLCQLALLTKANSILEMGSGYGYSAYWFAKGLKDGGKVVLTETSSQNLELARGFFRRGKMEDRARFELGDAISMIDRLPGEFDIIFVDVEKERYPDVYHKALPRLKPGGLLITDNILWGGSVLMDDESPSTRGIKEYTRLLYSSPNLMTTIIPIRDGVSISLKLS